MMTTKKRTCHCGGGGGGGQWTDSCRFEQGTLSKIAMMVTVPAIVGWTVLAGVISTKRERY